MFIRKFAFKIAAFQGEGFYRIVFAFLIAS